MPNPRLETSLDIKLQLVTKFLQGGGFFTNDGDASESSISNLAWIVSSGARGCSQWSIPLLGEGVRRVAAPVLAKLFSQHVLATHCLTNADQKPSSRAQATLSL